MKHDRKIQAIQFEGFFLSFLLFVFSFLPANGENPQEYKPGEQWAIQIHAGSDSLPVSEIVKRYGIDTLVKVKRIDGYYKYYIGPFNSLGDAKLAENRLKTNSELKEFFVTRFFVDESDQLAVNTISEDSVEIKKEEERSKILSGTKIDSVIINTEEFVSNRFGESKSKENIFDKRVLNYSSKHTLLIIITYFLILTVVSFSIVFLSRLYKQRSSIRRQFWLNQYQSVLADFLFNEEVETIPEPLKLITRQNRRQILLDEIIRLRTDLSGEVSILLDKLYNELNLSELSFKKLYRRRWNIKARGFRELAVMGVDSSVSLIEPFTKHRNETLRAEAYLALVKLKKDDPFYFLDIDDILVTGWDQLNLHRAIDSGEVEIPEFRRWLKSKNESVLVFSLKMAVIYQQFDAVEEIIALLKHPSEKIRNLAIKAVGEMEVPFADALLENFPTESDKNKIEIMRSLRKVGEAQHVGFIIQVLNNNPCFDLKFSCVRTLKSIEKYGIEAMNELALTADEEFLRIVAHVNDQRI